MFDDCKNCNLFSNNSPLVTEVCRSRSVVQFTKLFWSRFYESSQAMPTYRSYFDQRFSDTCVGFMKRHSDYHVTTVYTIAALIQFDGRARGDDVIGYFTVSK